jgi:hypothetical protein
MGSILMKFFSKIFYVDKNFYKACEIKNCPSPNSTNEFSRNFIDLIRVYKTTKFS